MPFYIQVVPPLHRGKAYACAVCHEGSDCPAASLGVWANRMICGQCSREQGYSPDIPCTGRVPLFPSPPSRLGVGARLQNSGDPSFLKGIRCQTVKHVKLKMSFKHTRSKFIDFCSHYIIHPPCLFTLELPL